MKLTGWLAGAVIAGGVVFAMRGCLSKPDPDERLAGRFDAMCEIARDNVKTPEKGVRALGRYLQRHTDDILGELGGTFATIESIRDDAKHDARARVARDRIRKPWLSCEDDWMKFGEAVERDPTSVELIERFNERLGRSLEIVFSGATLDLRDLPRQLEHALDQRLR